MMFIPEKPIQERLRRIRSRRVQITPTRRIQPYRKIQETSTDRTLWTHLVFMRITPRKIGRKTNVMTRTPLIVNGLFNQIFALFTAVDLARFLGRNRLVVGAFHVQFNARHSRVPLSRIIQLSSLLLPISDWDHRREPTPSHLVQHMAHYPSDATHLIQSEKDTTHLEIGCCLLFPLPGHTRGQHIRNMRFHPIFYEMVSSFLQAHPVYQVVHYRMEDDFTMAFFQGWGYGSFPECRSGLCQKYKDELTRRFDPGLPTLVVSHYYKNPTQSRDYDLSWGNLVHFTLSPLQKKQLCDHLQLPFSTPMREVDALIDFILCTTPYVRSFLGCAGSTFSEAVCLFHDHPNCSLLNPHKLT